MARKRNMSPSVSSTSVTPADSGRFEVLPIELIAESPTNPRKTFRGLQQLADSIRTKEVIQPILVRPASAAAMRLAGQEYELVCGARRYRASMMAGKTTIPAIIRTLSDVDVLEIQTIENDQREDVNPMEQALGYERLLKCDGYDVGKIATKTGRSESYVHQRLQLTRLLPEFQGLLLEERLPFTHARLIARIGQDTQKELLSDWAFKEHKSQRWEAPETRDLEHTLAGLNRNLAGAAWKKEDAELVPEAGPCSTCPHRTANNRTLFPDLDPKQDLCTNAVCYQKKQAAIVERKVDELERDGVKFTRIYDGSIPHEQRNEAKKLNIVEVWNIEEVSPKQARNLPADRTRVGLFVGGTRAGHVITITDIGHRPLDGSGDAAAEGRRKAEERKMRAARNAAGRIREQILQAMQADPDHERTITFVAQTFWSRAYNEAQKKIAAQLGWEKDKKQYCNRFDSAFAKFLAKGKLNAQDLIFRVAVECAPGAVYGGDLPDELHAQAKLFGIDSKAILKACQQEIQEKHQASKKKGTKAAK